MAVRKAPDAFSAGGLALARHWNGAPGKRPADQAVFLAGARQGAEVATAGVLLVVTGTLAAIAGALCAVAAEVAGKFADATDVGTEAAEAVVLGEGYGVGNSPAGGSSPLLG